VGLGSVGRIGPFHLSPYSLWAGKRKIYGAGGSRASAYRHPTRSRLGMLPP
jgi:hypothetical protein